MEHNMFLYVGHSATEDDADGFKESDSTNFDDPINSNPDVCDSDDHIKSDNTRNSDSDDSDK